MENKKKKKKRKLSSLILLLLITIVMLTTSTYAWFTANKTVTINSIDVNVATSSGLQISTDATNWKTVISNADITGAAYAGVNNQFPTLLAPVSTTNTLNATSKLLDFYSGTVTSNTGGDFILTSSLLSEANGTTGNYVAFDIYLRTDAEGPIYLTTSSNVTATTGHDDNGLKNASRVAFVQRGNATADKAAATLQALTAQAGITTGTTEVIWEPNYDIHTTYGITQAATYYGYTGATTLTATGAAAVTYYGVKAPIVDSDDVLLSAANQTAHASQFSQVTTVTTPATPTAYTQIFQLQKGVTKIRVYLWVEGQDVDCENNASGGYISYNIALSQNSGN